MKWLEQRGKLMKAAADKGFHPGGTGLMIKLQPDDYVKLIKERDQLRAENERLREALVDIKTRILDEHYKEAIQIIDRIAREVTK